MRDEPRWYEPVCLAITEAILWARVPREWCALEVIFTLYLVWYLHYWLFLPVIAVVHGVAVWWTKKDPQFIDVIKEHLRITGYYEV